MEHSEASTAEAMQAAIHLALGLLRQDNAIQRGATSPVTILDEQLQLGWDKLALLCLKNGATPPNHLPDLVAWLHEPIESWQGVGQLFDAAGLHGPMLYYGTPGELCDELARDMHFAPDPERELQDVAFKEILAYCQAHHLTQQYTRARRFLVENPYLPNGTVPVSADSFFDDEVRRWLCQAYEPVPAICRQESEGHECIALCPRCGWPLEWRTQNRNQANCYGELCSRLVSNLHDPSNWQTVSPEAMRTTRGIQASVVAPELALLELFRRLTDLELKCELWPEVDSYDLYVELPDGERWAVDMKDVASPTRLAAEVGHFRNLPEWDTAFFVFPEHRRHSDYLRTFRAHWARPQDTYAMYAKDFVRHVEERLE